MCKVFPPFTELIGTTAAALAYKTEVVATTAGIIGIADAMIPLRPNRNAFVLSGI